MKNEELERLVWQRIDGDLAPEDARRLERVLAGDAEARRRVGRIEELARFLEPREAVEPPVALRPRIDRALASARAPWLPRPSVLRPVHVGSWLPRLSYLAAGVLVGVVATLLLLPGPRTDVGRDRAAATMGAAAGQRLELALGEQAGRLELRREGDAVAVDLVLATPEELELAIQAEGGGLRLEGVVHGGGGISEVHLLGARVVARVSGAGEHRFSLRLDDPRAPLDVAARLHGRLVAEGRLGAEAGGPGP